VIKFIFPLHLYCASSACIQIISPLDILYPPLAYYQKYIIIWLSVAGISRADLIIISEENVIYINIMYNIIYIYGSVFLFIYLLLHGRHNVMCTCGLQRGLLCAHLRTSVDLKPLYIYIHTHLQRWRQVVVLIYVYIQYIVYVIFFTYILNFSLIVV